MKTRKFGYPISINKKVSGKPDWYKESEQIDSFDLVFGWDSEYRNREYDLPLEKKTLDHYKNDVISQQIAAYSKVTDKYCEFIIYSYKEQKFLTRISLAKIISITLELLEIKWYQFSKIREPEIFICGFFLPAEYSTLPSSDRLILNKAVNEVQKSFSTFQKIAWKIPAYESLKELTKNVKITIRDGLLLSPQNCSLNQLSQTTKEQKKVIGEHYYQNMVALLEENKELYESYAINDARIVIEYVTKIFNLINNNQITGREVTSIPITVTGITLAMFLKHWEIRSLKEGKNRKYWHEKIFGIGKGKQKISELKIDKSFADIAYLGGKNNVSRFYHDYNAREKNEIVIDIDIDAAYLRTLSMLPIVNWQERWKATINANDFLVEIFQHYNEKAKHIPFGLVNTSFHFKKIYEPYLGQKTDWGLIYALEGETIATLPEALAAFKAGGIEGEDIKEVYQYKTIKDQNGKTIPAFTDYLKAIYEERKKKEKGSLEYEFYKLLGNGLYGAISQGINERDIYNIKGEKEKMKISKITNSHYAAHCTAITRVILTSAINEIENTEGCQVINWTTDGIMLKMKWGEKYPEYKTDQDGKVIEKIKFSEIMPKVYQKLKETAIGKLLEMSNQELGRSDDEWIKVNVIGDRFGSEQTRGNWITWKDVTQHIARGNISRKIVKNVEQFKKYSLSTEVLRAKINSLVSFHKMKENKWDLVTNYSEIRDKNGQFIGFKEKSRKINLGPDAKRKLCQDAINTEPFKNIAEATKEREIIEYAVKQEIRRTPERISFEIAKRKGLEKGKKSLRVQNGSDQTILRAVISATLKIKEIKGYKEITEKINSIFGTKINEQSLKNWKHRKTEKKSIPSYKTTEEIIAKIGIIMGIGNIKEQIKEYIR